MSKSRQAANEAQLKARRTSLGKKSVDELITIILRKDKSERSMNSRIQELTNSLKEADYLNDKNSGEIANFDKIRAGLQDKIDSLIERNDNLVIEKNRLIKELVELKNKYSIICKGNIVCVCAIIVLIIYVMLF